MSLRMWLVQKFEKICRRGWDPITRAEVAYTRFCHHYGNFMDHYYAYDDQITNFESKLFCWRVVLNGDGSRLPFPMLKFKCPHDFRPNWYPRRLD